MLSFLPEFAGPVIKISEQKMGSMKRETVLFILSFLISLSLVLLLTQVLFPSFRNVEPVNQTSSDHEYFEESSSDFGVKYNYTNILHQDEGIYVADVNRDGFRDILLLGGKNPVLYRNDNGYMKENRTFEFGGGQVKSAHFFDYTDNGFVDLVIFLRGERPVFYENRGGNLVRDGRLIREKLKNPKGATSADFTGNGCSDLFIVQWGDVSVHKHINFYSVLNSRESENYNLPRIANGWRNYLFEGSCGGEFEDFSQEMNVEGRMWSQTASAADLNDDGKPDIHVANDFGQDTLYLNEGDRFERIEMGDSSDRHAMASTVADFNNDMRPDIFVSNIHLGDVSTVERTCYLGNEGGCILGSKKFPYQDVRNFEGNNLFINTGNGSFRDKAGKFGLRKGGWAWAASAADFTNNGYIDLVQGNTDYSNILEDQLPDQGQGEVYSTIRFWEGTQERFRARDSRKMGFIQGSERAVARIDINRDGCMDLVTTTVQGLSYYDFGATSGFKVYNNTDCDSDSYIQVDLRRDGGENVKGSEVILKTESRKLYRVRNARNNYRSQNTRLIHFGLRDNESLEQLKIVWPDEKVEIFENITRGEQYVFRP
jgi:hypothetical protein